MDKKLLQSYGIDFDKGVSNCMGDAKFFKTLLTMFLQDDCFPRARTAYAAGDLRALFNCLHELKGVSGNTALLALYQAVIPLVELLRGGQTPPDEAELARLFDAAGVAYEKTCEGIRQAIA